MSFLSKIVSAVSPLGGVISGIGSLVGGLVGSSSANKAADNQLQAEKEIANYEV